MRARRAGRSRRSILCLPRQLCIQTAMWWMGSRIVTRLRPSIRAARRAGTRILRLTCRSRRSEASNCRGTFLSPRWGWGLSSSSNPRLTAWAAFFRRFAATKRPSEAAVLLIEASGFRLGRLGTGVRRRAFRGTTCIVRCMRALRSVYRQQCGGREVVLLRGYGRQFEQPGERVLEYCV
jgi:hypothetical protein